MTNNNRLPDLNIEGARIIHKNFAGKKGPFNRAGDRSFSVIIPDPEMAQKLSNDGWKIKSIPPRDENEDTLYYIPVAVRFDNFPPRIYMITGRKKILLDEDSVEQIDTAEIINVDMTINPSRWNMDGKTGIKAYLKTMYVTIREDVYASKYSDYEM